MGAVGDIEEGGSMLIGVVSMAFFGVVIYLATNRIGNDMVNAARGWVSSTGNGA
tara:strand:+ start:5135 stop:5296 length:162 start_codon:yes stop_codon:yes gene_type:complete